MDKVPPHIFASGSDIVRVLAALDRIEKKLDLSITLHRLSLKQETHMAHELDALEAEVSQLDGVVPSVLALLDRLAVQIANAGTDPARLQKVTTDLMARRQALAEAVAKGTTAEDEIENPPTPVAAPMISAISPTSGAAAGGESIVISGAGLTGATEVQFGGTDAASFTVDSDTQITAMTPPLTGEFDVTVTTPAGHVSSAPATVTFAAVPSP